jgi:hypothetical protein
MVVWDVRGNSIKLTSVTLGTIAPNGTVCGTLRPSISAMVGVASAVMVMPEAEMECKHNITRFGLRKYCTTTVCDAKANFLEALSFTKRYRRRPDCGHTLLDRKKENGMRRK